MMSLILVNNGSGNGLLPDGTKPLPEPMLSIDISAVLCHLPEGNFTEKAQANYLWYNFEDY